MKTKVNKDICIGCGLCTSIAEMVYEMNSEGFAEATGDTQGYEDLVIEATNSCPVSAIETEE